MQEWRLLGVTLHRTTVSGIVHVELRAARSDDNRADLVLYTSPTHAVIIAWQGFTEKHRERLKEFQAFFQSRNGNPIEATIPAHPMFSVFMLLFGCAGILATRPTLVTLDRVLDQLEVVKPGIGKSRRRMLRLSDVEAFAVVQRYRELAEDPPEWMERHMPDLLANRPVRDERTVLVLAARLKTGKEIALFTPMLGGSQGLELVRELERVRKAPLAAGTERMHKPCAVCGRECDGAPRLKDQSGRYYHPACHEQLLAQSPGQPGSGLPAGDAASTSP
jgi:hypothetical protein